MVFCSVASAYIGLLYRCEESPPFFLSNACRLNSSIPGDVKQEHRYALSIGALVSRR